MVMDSFTDVSDQANCSSDVCMCYDHKCDGTYNTCSMVEGGECLTKFQFNFHQYNDTHVESPNPEYHCGNNHFCRCFVPKPCGYGSQCEQMGGKCSDTPIEGFTAAPPEQDYCESNNSCQCYIPPCGHDSPCLQNNGKCFPDGDEPNGFKQVADQTCNSESCSCYSCHNNDCKGKKNAPGKCWRKTENGFDVPADTSFKRYYKQGKGCADGCGCHTK